MSLEIKVDHKGVTYDAQVATVERTSLGTEDHGIFTAQVVFAGEGWGQAFPCRSLASSSHADKGYGIEHIWSIIRTLGSSDWESVKGKRCLVLRISPYGQIEGIADLDATRVLIFADHVKEWASQHPEQVQA